MCHCHVRTCLSLHTMPLVHSHTPTNHPLCKHNSSLERHYAHGSRRSQQNTSRQTGHTRPRRAARAHHPTRRPRCAMSSGRACVQMPFPHVASRSCRHNSLSPPLALGVSRQKEQHPERCLPQRATIIISNRSARRRNAARRPSSGRIKGSASSVAAAWAMAEAWAGAVAWARAAAWARARLARRRRP